MKKVFNIPEDEMMAILREVFLESTIDLLEHHHDEAEGEALKILDDELHPFNAFYRKAPTLDAEGNPITKEEYNTAQDVKDLLYGMMYGLRFCSQKELAHYLMLDEQKLIEKMQINNFIHLFPIQPALNRQKELEIPLGRRLYKTGFFDCGSLNHEQNCPACSSPDIHEHDSLYFCLTCKAGYIR